MPQQSIPERKPIGDTYSGVITTVDGQYLLSDSPLVAGEIVTRGDFVIRYGIHYLGKPQYAIVPGLVVLDYGEMLTGEDAWTFLDKNSILHPRADVIGYRNDGVDEMKMVRDLDFGIPYAVYGFENPEAISPIARIDALITSNTDDLPERIATYLLRFDTFSDWQQTQ